jgi:hypothetical protein
MMKARGGEFCGGGDRLKGSNAWMNSSKRSDLGGCLGTKPQAALLVNSQLSPSRGLLALCFWLSDCGCFGLEGWVLECPNFLLH